MLGEDGLIVKRARSVDYCPDRNVSFTMTRVDGVFIVSSFMLNETMNRLYVE